MKTVIKAHKYEGNYCLKKGSQTLLKKVEQNEEFLNNPKTFKKKNNFGT